MEEKVFGIEEAKKVLARVKKKPHIQTVMAVLDVLDVPNKLAEQVKEKISDYQEAIKKAEAKIAEIKSNDAVDEEETKKQVKDIQDARAQRSKDNKDTIQSQEGYIDYQKILIEDLQKLLKKFE